MRERRRIERDLKRRLRRLVASTTHNAILATSHEPTSSSLEHLPEHDHCGALASNVITHNKTNDCVTSLHQVQPASSQEMCDEVHVLRKPKHRSPLKHTSKKRHRDWTSQHKRDVPSEQAIPMLTIERETSVPGRSKVGNAGLSSQVNCSVVEVHLHPSTSSATDAKTPCLPSHAADNFAKPTDERGYRTHMSLLMSGDVTSPVDDNFTESDDDDSKNIAQAINRC